MGDNKSLVFSFLLLIYRKLGAGRRTLILQTPLLQPKFTTPSRMYSGKREVKVFGCSFWKNRFVLNTSFDIKTGVHRDFNASFGVECT
jgi:hypothetical protein